jgi:NAD+ synthase (glutamine-hydrolysing)
MSSPCSPPNQVRVRLGQFEVVPGDPQANLLVIRTLIELATADGVDLLLLPEMVIPGYLLGDEWEREAFLRECEACGEALRKAATDLVVVFGNVAMDWERRNEDGRVRKYNALFVADHGTFVGPESSPYPFVIKALMPNYRQFDDSRHFFDLRKLAYELGEPVEQLMRPVHTRAGRLGCLLCEDAWDMDYAISPLQTLAERGDIDLMVNASASPFTLNKNHKRNRVFSAQAKQCGVPIAYVNHTGIQNNGKTLFTFDGASCIYDPSGVRVLTAPPFAEVSPTIDLHFGEHPIPPHVDMPEEDDIEAIWNALVYGTRRFMQQLGVERVTIGVSGGIDSAVVAAIYGQILPPEQLLLVNMPSQYNSATTRSLAERLALNLGCYYTNVPIQQSLELTMGQIHGLQADSGLGAPPLQLELSPFMQENIQARDRSARVLAALASAFGGVFTCNANKSEMTVGYTTLYGDLGGYLANIADLWKGQVYDLARYLNREIYKSELIPQGSIDIVPSAELSHAQNVDEGRGDPLHYPYHDQLFASWVEWWNRVTPEEILGWYIDGTLAERIGFEGSIQSLFPTPEQFIDDLERWWNLYQGMALAKRIQAPPILAIKRRAFGFDHRESQLGARYSATYQAIKHSILHPTA